LAFRYFNTGATLAAKSDGKSIIVETPTGDVAEYTAPLNVVIPTQAFSFISNVVMFYLEHKGVCYVGRRDGTFSGYRLSDDMLVRCGTWDPPAERQNVTIGIYNDDTGLPWTVFLDKTDLRTAYTERRNKIFVFNKPFTKQAVIGGAFSGKNELYINTTEGRVDVNEDGRWFVPSVQRSRDIQL
jgi:hypothetical protein